MICPFCKEDVAQDTVKCEHCNSTLSPIPLPQVDRQNAHTAPENNATTSVDIDSLNISETLKKKFHYIHDNLVRVQAGFPIYKKSSFNENFSQFSVLATVFSLPYYIIKGMWRKALTLFLILFVLLILIFLIAPEAYQDAIVRACGMTVGIMAGKQAYYDLYRKHVLKEDFWW